MVAPAPMSAAAVRAQHALSDRTHRQNLLTIAVAALISAAVAARHVVGRPNPRAAAAWIRDPPGTGTHVEVG